MEENKIMEEALENAGFEVTETLPENPEYGKKLTIACGVAILVGIAIDRLAEPVAKWVKSKFEKKVDRDDFEIIDDAEFEEDIPEQKTE